MRWGRVAEVAEVWACRQRLTEVDSRAVARAGLHLVWSRALCCGGLRAPHPRTRTHPTMHWAFLACVHIRRRFLSRVTPPSPPQPI